jgi:hypothetical protein
MLMTRRGKEILRAPEKQGSSVQISAQKPNAIQLSKIHAAPLGHREAV